MNINGSTIIVKDFNISQNTDRTTKQGGLTGQVGSKAAE